MWSGYIRAKKNSIGRPTRNMLFLELYPTYVAPWIRQVRVVKSFATMQRGLFHCNKLVFCLSRWCKVSHVYSFFVGCQKYWYCDIEIHEKNGQEMKKVDYSYYTAISNFFIYLCFTITCESSTSASRPVLLFSLP